MDDSFESFARAHVAQLVRTATLLTADAFGAEDVVQEVLERMYAKWSRIDDPHAYARTAVARRVTDRWRRARRRPLELPLMASDDVGSVDAAQLHAERDAMLGGLRRLPPRQRAVIVLRYYEDLSELEIAQALGCSPGTVKSQASKGLVTLRAALAEPRTTEPRTTQARSER